ncbi:hypothetical protein AQ490_25025 [Wenjunlia vitaminophila]|uniref:Uncharacterized protein n=1 Tax=Wenjunlia vitaminophila TaxID=76728 RepID=A0A0T6LQY9_WENVI|nr:hypothetical protein AQ490_25025 [Wenjunlia vitaminophila]
MPEVSLAFTEAASLGLVGAVSLGLVEAASLGLVEAATLGRSEDLASSDVAASLCPHAVDASSTVVTAAPSA